MTEPINLTTKFEIVSYDGGKERDGYSVENMLNTEPNFHCSGDGKGFSLILKCETPVYVTNSTVYGPRGCTAPIKHGAVFVSDSEDFGYGEKFKDCSTKDNFDLLCTENNVRGGFFDCSKPECTEFKQDMIFFDPPLVGQYVHFLLISPMSEDSVSLEAGIVQEGNIDVGRFGIIGYESEQENFIIHKKVEDIPPELKLTRIDPTNRILPWKDQEDSILKVINERKIVFLGTNDESLQENFLKDIFSKDDFSTQNWVWTYFDWSQKGVMDKILDITGVIREEPSKDRVFIIGKGGREKWVFPEGDLGGVLPWLMKLKEGKLEQTKKSAPRPENDVDPNHEGLTILTRESFYEIALDPKKDVFVDVYADWCPPCRAIGPIIIDVAKVMADVPDILIAKFDNDANDKDEKYFPEGSIPNMKFFPQHTGEGEIKPIKFTGERTGKGFLEFIHEHSVCKFDLAVKVKAIEVLDNFRCSMDMIQERVVTLEKLISDAKEGMGSSDDSENKYCYEGDAMECEKYLVFLRGVLETCKMPEDLENLKGKVETPPEEVRKEMDEMTPFAERKRNGYVLHPKTREEYLKLRDDPARLVIVDYFATWCGPCVRIAPIYTKLSITYRDKNVVFVKVQEGELDEIIQEEKVEAFPTFKVFKEGKEIEKIVGGNIPKIVELIEEHTK